MSKEIGGYLELEQFNGASFHEDGIALNCGRGCLSYLIELRGIRSIWLPDFMCDSVYERFEQENVIIKSYPISSLLAPDYSKISLSPNDWLYLNDYYGTLSEADVSHALSISGGRLIVDETQGYFREPWRDADTIYTCRKWFGVPDGGYVYTKDKRQLDRPLPKDVSYNRMIYVLGRFEETASEFYALSQENNNLFSRQPAKAMSKITSNLLKAIDYEKVQSVRFHNWEVLSHGLHSSNKLNLGKPTSAPFMYPLYLDNADGIREKLAQKKIYIPTLWPNVAEKNDGTQACDFARNILPLPVDQRYGAEEMEMILEAVYLCLH